jgi:hypothetical protein
MTLTNHLRNDLSPLPPAATLGLFDFLFLQSLIEFDTNLVFTEHCRQDFSNPK